jgi:dynein light intermediate chain 1
LGNDYQKRQLSSLVRISGILRTSHTDKASGGSPETQKDFLEVLASDSPKRPQERHRKRPPIANEFALGYTYQDVLDADQEDILARVSIYTLLEPSLSFAPLLTPLLTARTVPETLLVILLDWAEPWKWVRQIRDWMKLCREVWPTLEDDARLVMGEIMQEWEQRRRGGGAYESGSMGAPGTENNVTIPLGPGEWDEGLGLPLCVVCHNVRWSSPEKWSTDRV